MVDTLKIVFRLYNVVNFYCIICYADRICFKNVTGLVVNKPSTFDMIGIVSQFYLYLMISV